MKNRICPRIYYFVLISSVFALLSLGSAQTSNADSPRGARVRALNNSILALHGHMQHANGGNAQSIRSQAAIVIAQRAAELTRLIQTNPHEALTFALSTDLLQDLAAKFPKSASQLESHITVTGIAQHWIADYPNSSVAWWRINTGGRVVNLFFAGSEPQNLKPNDMLRATGVLAGSQMAVEASTVIRSSAASDISSAPTIATKLPISRQYCPVHMIFLFGFVFAVPGLGNNLRSSRTRIKLLVKQIAIYALGFALLVFSWSPLYGQNSCPTTGVQQVAVLIVTFPGVSVPSFSPSLYDQFFGAAPSLTTYWQEASYGSTSATGGVFGPYTLNAAYSCSNINQFVDDALATASASGVNLNAYNRVDIVFPGMNPSCNWAGLSSLGCYAATTSAGTFNVSTSLLDWTKFGLDTIYHENGHQLGLAHSRLRTFGTEILGPIGAAGNLTEYGDHYATMGAPNPGHYAAGQKAEVLGWLNAGTTYQTVNSNGTYVLQPYESQGAGLNAIKIQRGTGNPGYYLWIEYRQPIGSFDLTMPYAAAPNGNVFTGALIHYEDSVTGTQSDLLDFTNPDTYADYPVLSSGRSWADPYSDLSLTVVSATSSALTVNVNYSGTTSCKHTNPGITLSPLDPSIYPGSDAGYNLIVTNNDSAGCSAVTFNMNSTQPSGWPTTFSTNSVNLAPGQSGSITMTKTGPAGTAPGTYLADANAANNSYVGSGTANLTVMNPPSLTASISLSGSSYALRSTIPITVSVTNGGLPASGANVTFTLTAPSGSTTTQSATTGSAGTATWSYKTNSRSATGSYTVSARATLSSGSRKATNTQSVTSNAVNFTVQ